MRQVVWTAIACALVVAVAGCQSGDDAVTSEADQVSTQTSTAAETSADVSADTPPSVTATVVYPWVMLVNTSVDPKPQTLNAGADTTCSMEEVVDTCDSPGPFEGDQLTIICFDDTKVGGIVGVVVPETQLVRPDQLRFRSKLGALPVGFVSIQAIGGWDYKLYDQLAKKLGVTVEDGLQCERHTARV